jgi:hypothetical protein
MSNCSLRAIPLSLKILITCFLLVMVLGYAIALVNTYDKMGRGYEGIVTHIRGSAEGLAFPKEFSELVELSHSHLFGMSIMYIILGFILTLTSLREVYKGGIIALAFISLFFYNLSFWLIRYGAPFFAYLLIFSNLLLALSFLVFVFIPLLEILCPEGKVYRLFSSRFGEKHL